MISASSPIWLNGDIGERAIVTQYMTWESRGKIYVTHSSQHEKDAGNIAKEQSREKFKQSFGMPLIDTKEEQTDMSRREAGAWGENNMFVFWESSRNVHKCYWEWRKYRLKASESQTISAILEPLSLIIKVLSFTYSLYESELLGFSLHTVTFTLLLDYIAPIWYCIFVLVFVIHIFLHIYTSIYKDIDVWMSIFICAGLNACSSIIFGGGGGANENRQELT